MQERKFLISAYSEGDLPRITFSEFGRDGNIFAVVGVVAAALRRSTLPDKRDLIQEIQTRVTSCHSYSEALAIAAKYATLADEVDDEEEYDTRESDWCANTSDEDKDRDWDEESEQDDD